MQGLQRIAHLTRISHIDRKALQPLDSLADVVAANGGRHDTLHIGDVEPVARCAFPINVDIDVATAGEPFGKHGGDTGYAPDDGLDLPRELVDDLEVRARDLDPDGALDSRGEHVDAVAYGRNPDVRKSRDLHHLIKF